MAAWQNENTKYDVTYSYSYDANGNITAISDGTNTTTYVYDSANQLIRENNQAGNFTHVWTYDDAGNILSRKEYAYTTGALGTPTDTVNYIYGDSNWGDKLTSYDGKTITYDGVGNPLNDGTWTYTWRHGRELSTMTNGTITVRNSYNPDGARIAKIVNRSNGSETHRYTYNGGKLVYDIIRFNNNGNIYNHTILMSYDESGRPFMITYNNISYYYLLNLQGDVVGIMNVSGDLQVAYTYDAWGNVLSITGPMADTMGQYNQLRYRGYVYDPETNLYFLNSRFYDPEKGRFINADAYASTGQGFFGCNMFTYCLNNPVRTADRDGEMSDDFWGWIGGQIGAFIYELITGDDHPQHQTNQLENQVIEEQNKAISSWMSAAWNAYVHSVELETERQIRQDMTVKNIIEGTVDDWKKDPKRIGDSVAMTTSTAIWYIEYVAFGAGVAIPGVGQAVMLGISAAGIAWSILRHYGII